MSAEPGGNTSCYKRNDLCNSVTVAYEGSHDKWDAGLTFEEFKHVVVSYVT